jgi:hypothetical protein
LEDRAKRDEIAWRLDAIHRAVETLLYPDELYEVFLDHVTKLLGASGAAIWRLEEPSDAELVACVGAVDDHDSVHSDAHARFLTETVAASRGRQEVILPNDLGNPTRSSRIIQQVHPRCPLVIDVALYTDLASDSTFGCAAFLSRMADLLATAKCLPWK